MTRGRVLAASAALCTAVAGCMGGRLPPIELYRLVQPDSARAPAPPANGGALAGALAIPPYHTPGVYGRGQLVYRVGEASYGSYPNREWAIPLGEMLGALTEGALRRQPITAESAAFDPPSRRNYAYYWRGSVREFEEVVRGRRIFAAVRLEAQLVRMADDSVLWTGSQAGEREVRTPSMAGIVETLSALAVEAIDALVADAKTAVRAPPPAGGAGRP